MRAFYDAYQQNTIHACVAFLEHHQALKAVRKVLLSSDAQKKVDGMNTCMAHGIGIASNVLDYRRDCSNLLFEVFGSRLFFGPCVLRRVAMNSAQPEMTGRRIRCLVFDEL